MQAENSSGGGARRVFLTAEWRYLLMLNYEMPAAVLRPFLPRGTELDLWEGRALASIVGFRFLRTQVLGVPVPFHRNFDEVNLRFYVRHTTASGEVRRGVVFIREVVPRRAIATVARACYNEPYAAMAMRSVVPAGLTERPGRVSFSWKTAAGWAEVSGTGIGSPTLVRAGSEEAFITEHYWGYTPQRDGGTVEYEVQHPTWRTWEVEGPVLSREGAGFYGPTFEPLLAEGSAVSVYRPRRLALGVVRA